MIDFPAPRFGGTMGEIFAATAAAVAPEGVTLRLAGQSAPTQKAYLRLTASAISAGDTVLCARISGTIVVLGRVGARQDPGGGSVTVDDELSTESENPVQNKVITAALNTLDAEKYELPAAGIPKTDLASAVQASLGKADSAYQKPSGGIPKPDLASAVQTSLGKADSAYQKPSGGIPKPDLASAVQTSLGLADNALLTARGTAIPENSDLNDYKTPGNYYIATASIAGTITAGGAPLPYSSNTSYRLSVLQGGGSGIIQILQVTAYAAGAIYIRLYLSSTWYAWQQIVRSGMSGASLASPSFTGTPTAPTAADGTNTTQIATTAFVQTAMSSKKPKQTAVSDPTASGTSATFIASITQDADGVITPQKKTVRAATLSLSGLMSADDKKKLDNLTFTIGENILINSYWGAGVINQRGQSSYEGAGYFIDRWKLTAESGAVISATLQDDGIVFANAGSAAFFVEYHGLNTVSLRHTFSVYASGVSGSPNLRIHHASGLMAEAAIINGISQVTGIASPIDYVLLKIPAGASVKILACKLEIGTLSTLAHYDSAGYVLNDVPDPDLEFTKCRRYYQRFTVDGSVNGYVIANVMAYSSDHANLTLRLGMKPTSNNAVAVTVSSLAHLVLAPRRIADGIPITGMSGARVTDSGDVVVILATEANTLTPGDVYNAAIKYNTGGWIAFSTEP